MRSFAELLDRLVLTPARNAKLTLVRDYLAATPDPERGWALASLTGELVFHDAKPAMIRRAVEARMDPVLFGWSYEFVGDLAETVSLVWPARPGANREPDLTDVVETLRSISRASVPEQLERWMDACAPASRWALLKLMTGELRVGLSARLAKTAAAMLPEPRGAPAHDVSEVEEVWHALTPPYEDLFAWLEGRAERPEASYAGKFRPVMLATPLDEADMPKLDPDAYAAEWKWDGIRVQAISEGGVRKLYSRTGDEVSKAFPDVCAAMTFEGAIDGELLVLRPQDGSNCVAPFADLQQRLNRKTADDKLMRTHPAGIRAYDLLAENGEDLRHLPFIVRRRRLEAFVAALGSPRIDLSPLVPFETWDDVARLRAEPPEAAAEGLMLKRWDSLYEGGRPRGPWFKFKRHPFLVDAVMMYAQRGSGRRSSFYSDYTFGCWTDAGELTPVGKAYSGITDLELKQLDKFVRDNTVERYGPVRAVRAGADFGCVLEIAFEGLQRSTRHKSGVAMRFPRINRIRWDKPAAEADRLETLEGMLDRMEAGREPAA
jgi:DNA ligase-1